MDSNITDKVAAHLPNAFIHLPALTRTINPPPETILGLAPVDVQKIAEAQLYEMNTTATDADGYQHQPRQFRIPSSQS